MADNLILTCPNCGKNIILSEKSDHVSCPHCAAEFTINISQGKPTLQPFNSNDSGLAIQIREQEIADLKKIIQDTKTSEGYRRNPYYGITFIVSLLFTLASFWAWRAYEVTIWIVFFIVGICICFISGIALRLQSAEYKEQSKKLDEMVGPYQAALERKQNELSQLKASVETETDKVEQ